MSTPILKSLQADPTSTVDLSAHSPVGLTGPALEVWRYLSENTPYWWSPSDLLTVERYCFLLGADRVLRKVMNKADDEENFSRFTNAWASMKSLSLELKSVEYALGVTPQGRAALKLAYPEGQGEAELPEVDGEAFDPGDL